MANELQGKRVAFLFTDGVEQVELTEPLEAIRSAGAKADLVSLEPGEVQMFQHLDKSDTIQCRPRRGGRDVLRVRRAGASRRGRESRPAAYRRRRSALRAGVLRAGQARGRRSATAPGR